MLAIPSKEEVLDVQGDARVLVGVEVGERATGDLEAEVEGIDRTRRGAYPERHDLTRQLYETLRVAGLAKDSSTERYLAEPAYNLAIEVPRGLGRSLLPMIGIWIVGTAIGCGLLYLALWLLAGGVEPPPGDLV